MRKKFFNNDFKKCFYPFIMLILTFCIGCFFLFASKGEPAHLRMKIIFFGFLPAIIYVSLLLICYFKCNTQKRVDIIIIISSILILFFFVYYGVVMFMFAFCESDNPITDVKFYEKKAKGNLLKAFPKKIPDNVQNVKFYYRPRFLQGGEEISLYYIDKNMTSEKFDKKYNSKNYWAGHLEEFKEKNGLIESAFYNTPADEKNENDYKIYLISGMCDNSGYCNHGNYLLAAFNDKTKEVLFKSEDW